MVTAEASTGGGWGQEQIPEARNVRPRPSSSAAWEYFTQFTAGDGRRKARCKKCNRVLAADTKTNGTRTLLRHGTGTASAWHAKARHYAARQHVVPCLLVPPCLSGSPGTALWSRNRAVSCQQARWHTSARVGPGTKTFFYQHKYTILLHQT